MKKEALARIKINKLLEAAEWRFFTNGKRPANIQLSPESPSARIAIPAG